MGISIVVTSGKGGVGKTTTTANLGAGLALLGHRVCMVDADVGLRNLDIVVGLENRVVYHLLDVAEGICRIEQALVRDKRVEGLFLLPAAQTRTKEEISEAQMRDVVADLKSRFDYVLVDSPAGIEHGFRAATAGADRAVVVATPEVASVRDADRVVGLLSASGVPAEVLVNRFRPGLSRRGDLMTPEDVEEVLAVPLLGVVPEDAGIVVTTNRGELAVLDARSAAGRAYRAVCRRVAGLPEEAPQRGGIAAVLRLVGLKGV